MLDILPFISCAGITSGLFHLFINWHSNVPTIGASGAIAGVMGAYLISYPKSRILTLIPIIFIPYFIEIPAFFFLGIWFLFQFLNAAGSSALGGGDCMVGAYRRFYLGNPFLKDVFIDT